MISAQRPAAIPRAFPFIIAPPLAQEYAAALRPNRRLLARRSVVHRQVVLAVIPLADGKRSCITTGTEESTAGSSSTVAAAIFARFFSPNPNWTGLRNTMLVTYPGADKRP